MMKPQAIELDGREIGYVDDHYKPGWWAAFSRVDNENRFFPSKSSAEQWLKEFWQKNVEARRV